nr:MAG TPA: Protein of unknown function (DUF5131) [Caudoviricetes sp.]
MGYKTKVDWCDSTWSPVTGCLHGCEYCYARKIAERFSTEEKNKRPYLPVLDVPTRRVRTKPEPYPYGFKPTFHRYKLDEPQHWKKPRNIFVCSMADLFGDWVPDEWIQEVFKACDAAPQHRYIFLTKNPHRYYDLIEKGILTKHDNWWLGSTIDGDSAKKKRFQERGYNSFVSIEPLLEPIYVGLGSFGSDEWVIIGAETGIRKGKVVPDRSWVDLIVSAANITGMKVFMKESLREIMGDDFRQELPWEDKQ